MSPRLVAIDLPGGPAFVTALQRIWDAGDVAFPVEQRLPPAARDVLLAAIGPDAVVDADDPDTTIPMHDASERRSPRAPLEEGDALVMATSGSTGTPKGVVLTHDAVVASAVATSARLGRADDDHWLACLPLSHIGGLAVVTRALTLGTRLTVHDRFDAGAVAAAAASGATLVSLVKTALARVDAATFRVIVVGGAPAPEHRAQNVVATYGLTETGSGVVYDGRPLEGVEVRIAESGEIHLRGPMLLRAYRDGTDPKVGGWLPTGDQGRWNDDGSLHVIGRRGDMIITGGENVWPEPVEAVLRSHPLVADVAVAGTDDAEWGQAVTAFVVPSGPAPPTLEALRDAVKAQLPPYCAPQRLELVTAIPRTSLGKPRRSALVSAPSAAGGGGGPRHREGRHAQPG
jgi:O-succinylbenzoic acid--CoA ligase